MSPATLQQPEDIALEVKGWVILAQAGEDARGCETRRQDSVRTCLFFNESTVMRTYFCLEAVDAWSNLLALRIIHRLP